MSEIKRRKYIEALKLFLKESMYPPELMCVAIIYTQLGMYVEALQSYRLALKGFVELHRSWMGQINWVIDCFILAHQTNLLNQVTNIIEEYRRERKRALMGYYGSAITRLIAREEHDAIFYVSELLKRPKIEDTFALGEAIRSIIDKDQTSFDQALITILQIHHGRAQYGGLRESPEGFMSLSAMSLSKIAMERGFTINIENEYLAQGYLEFLMHND